MSTITIKLCSDRIGIKFGGPCRVCKTHVNTKDGVLYKGTDGKFHPVHANLCSGGKLKNKIGGGIVWRYAPKDELEVEL